jgi:hypothetical protein
MNKITVVCHKDHSHGYEDFEGKCLLCVVDDLIAKLKEKDQLIKLLKEEVGFAERGYTKRG